MSEQPDDYTPIAPLAVVGLALGLASPLALASSLLWIIPALGAGAAAVALLTIRKSQGTLRGSNAARIGLALSLVFATAGPAYSAAQQFYLSRSAQPLAEKFFDLLKHGQPHKALQLTLPAEGRQSLSDELWNSYRLQPERRQQLEKFVAHPVVRFLLEKRNQAQVRYFESGPMQVSQDQVVAVLYYAVTFEESGTRKTLFIEITVERGVLNTGEVSWKIRNFIGGKLPSSMDDGSSYSSAPSTGAVVPANARY